MRSFGAILRRGGPQATPNQPSPACPPARDVRPSQAKQRGKTKLVIVKFFQSGDYACVPVGKVAPYRSKKVAPDGGKCTDAQYRQVRTFPCNIRRKRGHSLVILEGREDIPL